MFFIMSVIAAFAAIGIAGKLSPGVLKRLLHYDILLDILVTVGFSAFMGSTIMGLCVGITTGAIFSSLLYVARKLMGTIGLHKIEGRFAFEWINHEPEWTPATLGQKAYNLFHPSANNDSFISNFKSSYRACKLA